MHNTLDSTCPLDKRALFPGRVLKRDPDRKAFIIKADRNGYDGITRLCSNLLARSQAIAKQESV